MHTVSHILVGKDTEWQASKDSRLLLMAMRVPEGVHASIIAFPCPAHRQQARKSLIDLGNFTAPPESTRE